MRDAVEKSCRQRVQGRKGRRLSGSFFAAFALALCLAFSLPVFAETLADLDAAFQRCKASQIRYERQLKEKQCRAIEMMARVCRDWTQMAQRTVNTDRHPEAVRIRDYHCNRKNECQMVADKLKSVKDACGDIEKQRNALATYQGRTSGSLTSLGVTCEPKQVAPEGSVTCQCWGTFSGSGSAGVNLTHDPRTTWQTSVAGQTGPVVAARGFQPGQSFTVRATWGSMSDGATVTVVQKGSEGKDSSRLDTMVFQSPMLDGVRLDVCVTYGEACGKPAADRFCKTKGYRYAESFEEVRVGPAVKTKVMGDGRTCDADYCTAFAYVKCAGKN